MTERKAVIKNADMSEEMQQDAIDCATQVRVKPNWALEWAESRRCEQCAWQRSEKGAVLDLTLSSGCRDCPRRDLHGDAAAGAPSVLSPKKKDLSSAVRQVPGGEG